MTSGLETSDSRIVISSEALKSLSFAFKWSMSGTPKREACYFNNLRASPRLQKSTRSVAPPKPSPAWGRLTIRESHCLKWRRSRHHNPEVWKAGMSG